MRGYIPVLRGVFFLTYSGNSQDIFLQWSTLNIMVRFLKKIKIDKADIVLSIVTLLIFTLFVFSPVKPKKFADKNFHRETKNWVNIIFTDDSWNSFYIKKAPGPDIYYLIPYALIGPSGSKQHYWFAGIAWNGIFMVLAVLLVKRIASLLFDYKVGVFSGILMLIFPIHIYYALGINGESMVYVSFILLLYGGIKWSRTADKPLNSTGWWCFLLGSLLLMSARLNFVVIIPVILLFLLITIRKKNSVDLRKGLLIYCLLLGLFMIATRVSLNNLPGNKGKDYHNNYGAYVLHMGRFQFREEPWDWRFWEGDIRGDSRDYINWKKSKETLFGQINDTGGRQLHSIYNSWVINDYISHPLMALRQFIVKTVYGNVFIVNSFQPQNFRFGPLRNITGYFIFHFLVNSVNLLLIIGFIGFIWKNRKFMMNDYWLIPVLFLTFVGFYSLTYMEPRYLFPIRVLYIITAADFWLGVSRRRIKLEILN